MTPAEVWQAFESGAAILLHGKEGKVEAMKVRSRDGRLEYERLEVRIGPVCRNVKPDELTAKPKPKGKAL